MIYKDNDINRDNDTDDINNVLDNYIDHKKD